MIRQLIQSEIEEALKCLAQSLPEEKTQEKAKRKILVTRNEPQKDSAEFTSKAALSLSGSSGMTARSLAYLLTERLSPGLKDTICVSSSESGYINFKIQESLLQDLLRKIHQDKGAFGSVSSGLGKCVSLNTILLSKTNKGHSLRKLRSTLIANALSNLFKFCSYKVVTEQIPLENSDPTKSNDYQLRTITPESFISIWSQNDEQELKQWRIRLTEAGVCPENLESVIVQNVRAGEEESLPEVKHSALLAYFLLSAAPQEPLTLQLSSLKECSLKNPAFRISLAYKRCAALEQILEGESSDDNTEAKSSACKWEELQYCWAKDPEIFSQLFLGPKEESLACRVLILRLDEFQEKVEEAIESRSPQVLCNYASALAQDCLNVLNLIILLPENGARKTAQSGLLLAAKQCLENSLKLLGLEDLMKMLS